MILYPVFLYSVFYDARFTENIFWIASTIEWNLTFRFSPFHLLFEKNNNDLNGIKKQ